MVLNPFGKGKKPEKVEKVELEPATLDEIFPAKKPSFYSRLKQDVNYYLKDLALAGIGCYFFFSLFSHNGCFDSLRTKDAMQYRSKDNLVKVVESVEEEWKDNEQYMVLDGYNPKVIRKVKFKDGSDTWLSYRTMAHQPYMKWLHGDEFDPKVGERYEVRGRVIVRKVE
ncbi:hypothetical protein KY330_00505 [Candidatus Woesearchaeota archaeon]|nr:hypothetical protein [Candidatus Woesearchaeota archaeon]